MKRIVNKAPILFFQSSLRLTSSNYDANDPFKDHSPYHRSVSLRAKHREEASKRMKQVEEERKANNRANTI